MQMGNAKGSLFLSGEPIFHASNLDEDEITLAVSAARQAMALGGVTPESVKNLEIGTTHPANEVPSWAHHVQLALGLRGANVLPYQPGLREQTLQVAVDSGRGTGGVPAFATAVVGADLMSPPRERPVNGGPSAGRGVDRSHLERLRDAESRSLAQVPMGAYVPRGTWDASLEARYRLLVSTCSTCKKSSHPPFAVCPTCRNPTTVESRLDGTIHTFTTIAKGAGPTEFDEWQALDGDYVVAIVDVAPGVRVAGMMTSIDPKTVKIGQRVRGVLRRLYAQEGAWRYGTKFQLLDDVTGR